MRCKLRPLLPHVAFIHCPTSHTVPNHHRIFYSRIKTLKESTITYTFCSKNKISTSILLVNNL